MSGFLPEILMLTQVPIVVYFDDTIIVYYYYPFNYALHSTRHFVLFRFVLFGGPPWRLM